MNQKRFSIILFAVAVVVVTVLTGVVVPKIVIRDASGLIPEKIESAKRDTRMLLNNPIERGLMVDMAAVAAEGDMIRVDVYTFGGIKYATIAVTPNREARVIWRRWFGGVYAPKGAGTAICTQEAKLCPDGSFVGKIPPNCEFAACSAPTGSSESGGEQPFRSGISGTVFIGPQCPVVGLGMEEQCADKPYEGTLVVMKTDRKTEVARFTSDVAGKFRVSVPPGDYIIASLPRQPLPHCSEPVKVEVGKFVDVAVHCDSGIR